MRYLQPSEASLLLEALFKITEIYHNEPSEYPSSRRAYVEKLEAMVSEMAHIAQDTLDTILDNLETGKGTS